jgi:predicted PhzF superfamily epimerase YddE/YHI9
MSRPLFQVDAFTRLPFAGNPAAVCLLEHPEEAEWMQHVACEMNLSETAFLHPHEDGWGLRWFTPTVEVALCGHATLASAHVLWETGRVLPAQEARFHTLSGLLTARRDGDWIEIDFPSKCEEPAVAPPGLLEALGSPARYVGRNAFDYLVEVADEAELLGLRPNFGRLAAIPVRGIIVTSMPTRAGFDFVSRFFAPAAGVNEDPVTGSAHCCLGPFWSKRLGKVALTAFQASARGGVVRVKVVGDRTKLIGQAVTIFRGELL